MVQLLMAVIAGLVVEVIVNNSRKQSTAAVSGGVNQATTPLAAIAAANNARSARNVGPSNLDQAQTYDLNYFPNASTEVGAAAGLDTGGGDLLPPNATPTFVDPSDGAI